MEQLRLKSAIVATVLLAGSGIASAAAFGDAISAFGPGSGFLIAGNSANCGTTGMYAAATWEAEVGATPSMTVNASSCGVRFKATAGITCANGFHSTTRERPTGAAIGITEACGEDNTPATYWWGELIANY